MFQQIYMKLTLLNYEFDVNTYVFSYIVKLELVNYKKKNPFIAERVLYLFKLVPQDRNSKECLAAPYR